MEQVYWNGEGKYQELYLKLHKLIPNEGEVKDPKNNPALEKLRKASGCYYDLYNNGLCNLADEFRKVFGMSKREAKATYPCLKLEEKMDELILKAGKEQSLNRSEYNYVKRVEQTFPGTAPSTNLRTIGGLPQTGDGYWNCPRSTRPASSSGLYPKLQGQFYVTICWDVIEKHYRAEITDLSGVLRYHADDADFAMSFFKATKYLREEVVDVNKGQGEGQTAEG